ncbi:MAG: DUF998 domain-containing protein [Pseudonocardiaceae bacterium]
MTLAPPPVTTAQPATQPMIRRGAASFAVWSARSGTVTAVAAFLSICALEIYAALTGINLLQATLSQHALRAEGWAFNAAIVLLAAGSAGIHASLAASGIVRLQSAASLALGLWCTGLLLVALFTKHDWSAGPSPSGYAHWMGSVLAFLSLPAAVLLLARPWRGDPRWRGHAGLTSGLGLLAILCLVPIGTAMAIHLLVGIPWWEVVHLGLVERLLAFAEVVAVLAVGRWAISASRAHLPLRHAHA